MMPQVGMLKDLKNVKVDEKEITRLVAIVDSMTEKERNNHRGEQRPAVPGSVDDGAVDARRRVENHAAPGLARRRDDVGLVGADFARRRCTAFP